MDESFKEKDDKYRVWTTQETREKKVVMAVMVPLIISHDGAVHVDTVRRWKTFAPDLRVNWVRMAQSVLRYNVVIVGKFFNRGNWVSEAWKRQHPDEFEEPEGPLERIPTMRDRRERLHLETEPLSAVCVRSSDTPPPHDVRLTSAGKGHPLLQDARTTQPKELRFEKTIQVRTVFGSEENSRLRVGSGASWGSLPANVSKRSTLSCDGVCCRQDQDDRWHQAMRRSKFDLEREHHTIETYQPSTHNQVLVGVETLTSSF